MGFEEYINCEKCGERFVPVKILKKHQRIKDQEQRWGFENNLTDTYMNNLDDVFGLLYGFK